MKPFERYIPVIENKLNELLPESGERYSSAVNAMRYSLLSGGKRIRPILLLEFYSLFGGRAEGALNFAAAIEMIHTYSLIHDDLPCMDNDDMRRGNPSCHKAFGYDTALLAGDALLTHAFLAAASTADIPPERVSRAISVLAQKAGIYGMVGGQVMDLDFEKNGANGEELTAMYIKKTSCLLEAAAMCGAVLAGADEETVKKTEEYAENLGLAFQITDDILDCTADEKTLGKPIGSDEKNGKTTFVTLLCLDGAKQKAALLTKKAEDILNGFSGNTSYLKELTEYLLNRNY
ncbi:MAG TPA: hypothetical protein DCY23_04760 [Ruminococcaceae bacterium]|nr:hypothetical protein [Oscillospiraceae bacterium]